MSGLTPWRIDARRPPGACRKRVDHPSQLSRRRGRLPRRLAVARIDRRSSDDKGILWVDIQGPEEHAGNHLEDWLCTHFHFHHWPIEDALQETHIPKVDDWGDYLYIVFHVARIDPETEDLELQELDIFLGRNYLVTYHTAPMPILDQDRAEHRARSPRPPAQRRRSSSCSASSSWRSISPRRPSKSSTSRSMRSRTRSSTTPRRKNLKTIFRIKRSAIQLHKILSPQREVLNRLARDPYKPIQPKHRVYFRDLYDHVVRIHDISESLRDLISGTLETYLSVVSNRTNDIMKTLTIVTVMFMPMSFLVGFFGMNFFGETWRSRTDCPEACSSGDRARSWRYHPVSSGFTRGGRNGFDDRRRARPSRDVVPMNARWRMQTPRPGADLEPEPRRGHLAAGGPALAQSGDRRARPRRAFLEARMGSLHDPELIPGRGRGRRTDRAGDPGRPQDRHLRRLRRRRRLRHEHLVGVPAAGRQPAHVEYYIPHRVEEGYGVNADALRRLAAENKAELIVTVDCGISAVREAELARELGVELIVTDHHTIGSDAARGRRDRPSPVARRARTPAATSAARRWRSSWPGRSARASATASAPRPISANSWSGSLGLVALATIADVVPLSDENRVMVRHGLAGIAAGPERRARGTDGSERRAGQATADDRDGRLRPGARINAAGRLERAMMAVEMLTTDDPAQAREIAAELDRCNARRQEVERQIYEEAHEMIKAEGGLGDRGAIVLGTKGWQPA